MWRTGIGFVLGVVLGGTAVWWAFHAPLVGRSGDEAWALPNFDYQELAPFIARDTNDEAVYITGTLMGNHVGYPVNTWNIRCFKNENRCEVASVNEIGRRQLGSINLFDWPIVSWTPKNIVVQDEVGPNVACARTTITINRQNKTVQYMSVPENAERDDCKQARKLLGPAQVEDWTIGNPKEPWD